MADEYAYQVVPGQKLFIPGLTEVPIDSTFGPFLPRRLPAQTQTENVKLPECNYPTEVSHSITVAARECQYATALASYLTDAVLESVLVDEDLITWLGVGTEDTVLTPE